MLDSLDPEDRLRLMRFVCSFAWADLEIRDSEREYIAKLSKRLGLSEEDKKLVDDWLEVPPRPEELDPGEIPLEHRQLFLDAARATILADGEVDEEEAVNLALLEQLVKG